MKLYRDIRDTIERAIPELAGEAFDLQPTPDNQPGDFGMPCFRLAGKLGLKPPQAAARIAALEFPPEIASITTAGPYVNFTLDRETFATGIISEALARGKSFGSDGRGAGRHVLLEHTSINPNASPHIGRARNGLLGDALARILRFEGYDVDVHYYVNDMGKQIGLLVIQTEGREDISFDDILAEYVAANERAKTDTDFERRGFELLMKMDEGDPETKAKFTALVDKCLAGQLAILGRLGLTYNTFDRESSFLKDARMDAVMEVLREKGALFTDDDKRTVADISKLGWQVEEGRYIVLARANGSSMYMYRDIAYTLEKIERATDYNFIVLGEDHKMYFEQLATIIRAAGKTPPEPIHYSFILLKEGKMSTRQGNVVLLSDFLDEAERLARVRVDEQWPDRPDAERADVARIIAGGAVRFAILSVRPTRNVIFDWEQALNFNGDSGPYIQYSCTRISSILRKHGEEISDTGTPMTLAEDAEWALVKRLSLVEGDIATALEQRNPAIIANAALDVARRFSVFYNACPVLSAETEELKRSRLLICTAVRQALVNLLELIGIEAPERM